MSGFIQYYCYGEKITDIKKWCEERGQRLIKYKKIVTSPNPFTGETIESVSYGEMPESFYNSLRINQNEKYEEIQEGEK